jgi:hypothetical protein
MTETALVSLLMEAGVRHRTAVRVERILDDHGGGGVSGDWLALIILHLVKLKNVDLIERVDNAEAITDLVLGKLGSHDEVRREVRSL